MTVSPLAPELVYIILGSLSAHSPLDRTQTLLACSLVNSTFREVAQRELGKRLHWLDPWPGRVQAFLRSPSCPPVWRCEQLWLRQPRAEDVFALLARAEEVRRLCLFVALPEDREAGSYERLPEGALGSLRGEYGAVASDQRSRSGRLTLHFAWPAQRSSSSLSAEFNSTFPPPI